MAPAEMMRSLLQPDRVVLNLRAANKAKLLQDLARRAAAPAGVDAHAAAAALAARELLGSTGVGNGFALPHARMDGLAAMFGLFARLAGPIPFDAIDEKPVDLVFMLLIPSQAAAEHLAALAAISRRMRDTSVARRLRHAETPAAAYDLLAGAAG
ncbi:MAG TPA: PTS sugar transporter subunit IIA [Acetobacteraceae bacterium]|nr:PTS sugar transporter subunit IIA [Acetobacteraceae bacterium]